MALAVDLMGVGLPQEQAVRLGVSAWTTVAGVGTAQSGAAAIKTNNIFATTASGQTAFVLLSTMELEGIVEFYNSTATTALVYPPIGGFFNGQSVNTAFAVPQGASVVITKKSATKFTVAGTISSGVAGVNGQTVLPSNWHTGAIPAQVSTDGNDTTPSITTTYICAVFVPCRATITGVRLFNGTVASGNIKLGLFDSTGVNVAASASTAMSGTDAYQQVAFAAAYVAEGPATYYVGLQVDNTTARVNTHAFGPFPASSKTGETYGTFTTITPPTTFTANVGPIASLY